MNTTTLPLFPLGLVVFPFEDLHLHIFEPRYQELVHDCLNDKIKFGIPPYIDDKLKPVGTEIQLIEVVNTYDNGRMDIRCKGLRIFEVQKFVNPLQPKLYAGGDVLFRDSTDNASLSDKVLLLEKVGQMFELMDLDMMYSAEETFLSFKIGHKVGFSAEQEFQLLSIPSEKKRIEFIIDYLTRAIPMLKEVEKTKKRVKMNGHFKHFNPLQF